MLSYSTYEEAKPKLKVYPPIYDDKAEKLITADMTMEEISDVVSSRISDLLMKQIRENIENQKKSHKLIS